MWVLYVLLSQKKYDIVELCTLRLYLHGVILCIDLSSKIQKGNHDMRARPDIPITRPGDLISDGYVMGPTINII